MHVTWHHSKTEITGGITVVTALEDIPALYLAVDNTRPNSYRPDMSWLMAEVSSTPFGRDAA